MSAKRTDNALGRQFQHVTQANNLITLMAVHETSEQLTELLRKYDHHIAEIVRTAAERGQSDGVIAGYIRQNSDLLAANIRFEQRARDAEALAGVQPSLPEAKPVLGKLDPTTGRLLGDHGTAQDAVEFCLEILAGEHQAFLKAWNEGNLGEWPEYYRWLDMKGR